MENRHRLFYHVGDIPLSIVEPPFFYASHYMYIGKPKIVKVTMYDVCSASGHPVDCTISVGEPSNPFPMYRVRPIYIRIRLA